MDKEIKRWYKKIWNTRGARFNAFRRVKRIDEWSNRAIITFSVYLVGLNCVVFIDSLSESFDADTVTVVNVILSAFILALSIYINAKDHKVEYLSHHECGKKLGRVYNAISSYVDKEEYNADIEELVNQYQSIIEGYRFNHEPEDWDYFLYTTNQVKYSEYQVARILYQYKYRPILFYFFIIITPPLVFFYYLS